MQHTRRKHAAYRFGMELCSKFAIIFFFQKQNLLNLLTVSEKLPPSLYRGTHCVAFNQGKGQTQVQVRDRFPAGFRFKLPAAENVAGGGSETILQGWVWVSGFRGSSEVEKLKTSATYFSCPCTMCSFKELLKAASKSCVANGSCLVHLAPSSHSARRTNC